MDDSEAFLRALPHSGQAVTERLCLRSTEDPIGQTARAVQAHRCGRLEEARHWAQRCARHDDPRLQALAATILLEDYGNNPGFLDRLGGFCAAAGTLRFRLVPIRLALRDAAKREDADRHAELVEQARMMIGDSDDREIRDELAFRHVITLSMRESWLAAEAETRQLLDKPWLKDCFGLDARSHLQYSLYRQGRYQAALDGLTRPCGDWDAYVRINCLAWLGRHEEAAAELAELRRGTSVPLAPADGTTIVPWFTPASAAHLPTIAAWEAALARGQVEQAIAVIRDAALPGLRERTEIALLRRRAEEARADLASMRRGRASHMHLRLALLDGDLDEAGAIAREIHALAGPLALHRAFQRAHEATPAQASAVWQALLHRGDGDGHAPAPGRTRPRAVASHDSPLIGSSAAMTQVRRQIHELAARPEAVLILGETGTGKELAARELHRLGAQAAGPFVAVNCAAIPESLAESMLFGHRRGAFTGAEQDRRGLVDFASGGTLFLDEIGAMPSELQATLLRLLENGEYRPIGEERTLHLRARVVAAANRDLRAAAAAGSFREDLFWRLERWTLPLPALRDHPEDLEELYRHFASLSGAAPPPPLPAALLNRWRSAPWQGNVREFRNLVERLLALRDPDGSFVLDTRMPAVPAPAPDPAPSRDLGPPAAAKRRRQIIALLARQPELNRLIVARHLSCALATAAKDLEHLVACGILKQVGDGPPRLRYFVRA